MPLSNGMCPACKVVPKNAGRAYCAGCESKINGGRQRASLRKRQERLATWRKTTPGERRAPVDWRTVLADADASRAKAERSNED